MPWGVSLALGLWLASCHEVGLGAPCVMVALAAIFLEHRGWMAFMPIAMFGWMCGTFLLAMKAGDRQPRNPSATIECVDVVPHFVPKAAHVGDRARGTCVVRNDRLNAKAWLRWPKGEKVLPGKHWVMLQPVDGANSDPALAFDWHGHLQSLGVVWEGQVLQSLAPLNSPAWRDRLTLAWRQTLTRRLGDVSCFPLILGMFGGDRSLIGRLQRDQFSGLGIAHVLAVSGYHVGLVAGIFLLLLRHQNRWVKRLSVAGVLLAWWFVFATGTSHSAIRAASMLTLAWGGWVSGLKVNAWQVWGIAGCLVWAWDPMAPSQLGTQLSFAATAGLIGWRNLRWWNVPVVAQWATIPWSLGVFGGIPALFWPVNVAMGPWLMGFAVLAGLGLAWEPRIHSFLEAWVRGLDACLEVVWGQWPDQRVGSWMLSWDKRHVVLVLWGLLGIQWMPQGFRRRLVVRCLVLAACMVTIGFATLRVQQPSAMVMLALRSKTPTYLLHDGRMATGWHTRPKDSVLVIAAAKNLGLHLGDQHCLRRWPFTKKVHSPFEAWTHSWISWSPSDTVTSTSKSISSISTSW